MRQIPEDHFNILFTCAGRRVSLLKAFRSAMSELGLHGKLIATDITDSSPAFHVADEGVIVPVVGTLEYIPKLLEIVQAHHVRLLVPLTDLDLRSLARQKDRFTQAGCTVMVAPEQTIKTCRDKLRTDTMLDEAGLEHIKAYRLSEFRKKPFYPCFIKPIRGSGSVGTAILRNIREFKAHVATYGDLLIVQEYVQGPEFTIDVYRSQKGEVKSVVPRQRLVIRSGEVEKGITVKDDKLIGQAVSLAQHLEGIWGVFCCQCRKDEDGTTRFFEINPRFGGGVPLSIAAGANFPLYLLQEVTGRDISAEVGQFTDKLMMMRYDDAVFCQAEAPAKLPGYKHPYTH